jgi:hypothetical protein
MNLVPPHRIIDHQLLQIEALLDRRYYWSVPISLTENLRDQDLFKLLADHANSID